MPLTPQWKITFDLGPLCQHWLPKVVCTSLHDPSNSPLGLGQRHPVRIQLELTESEVNDHYRDLSGVSTKEHIPWMHVFVEDIAGVDGSVAVISRE